MKKNSRFTIHNSQFITRHRALCIVRCAFMLLLLVSYDAQSQELNCNVTVNASMIPGSDKTIFQTLQTAIRDFMNQRQWTTDKFLNQERIECTMLINITQRPSTDQFAATLQIQSRRPVYKSSYNSPMINYMDQDITFSYVQDQVLTYAEAGNTYNLTSLLAYWAYIIIGFDYDSFSSYGGNPWFTKAQSIVTDAQNLPDKGWHAYESTNNRYWLTDNIFNVQFKPVRDLLYIYHRQALDQMTDNLAVSRAKILAALDPLKKVNSDQPNSMLLKVLFNAKADELVSIFSGSFADEKSQVVTILNEVDPADIAKYSAISSQALK